MHAADNSEEGGRALRYIRAVQRERSSFLAFGYRFLAGSLAGAQIFFSAVAAQAAFPKEVAALPQGDPARTHAADLVGKMLASLDRLTLVGCALAVLCAVFLGRGGAARSYRRVVPPLIAGVLAAISAGLITPAIHAMRAAGTTKTSAFGLLHATSAVILLAEIAALVVAVWMASKTDRSADPYLSGPR